MCIRMYIQICTRTYICMSTRMSICMSARMSVCVSTRMSVCMSTRMSIRMSTRMSIRMSTRMDVYMHVHTNIYTKIHTHVCQPKAFRGFVETFLYCSVYAAEPNSACASEQNSVQSDDRVDGCAWYSPQRVMAYIVMAVWMDAPGTVPNESACSAMFNR